MPGFRRRAAIGLVSALALLSQVTPPAFADDPSDGSTSTADCEQWVVTLSGAYSSAFEEALAADDLAQKIGAQMLASVPQLHAHLLLACGDGPQRALAQRADERIALAFPNVAIRPTAISPHQWYLHNAGQPYYVGATSSGIAVTNEQARMAGLDFPSSVAGADVGWEEAQAKFPNIRGGNVTVAVVDTGVDTTLPELAGRIAPGAAAIDCALDFVLPYSDDIGHGTAVASLIAANGQSGGMTGVAPDAKVLPVQPHCSYADPSYGGVLEYAMGVLYAGENAQVINLSNAINPSAFADYAGQGTASPLYLQALALYKTAIDDAVGRGAILVAAAGNFGAGGQSAIDRGFLPDTYAFPASFPHVVSVGSTRSDGAISAFSTFNDAVDLAAPGESILTLRSSFVTNCGQVGDYSCFVNLNGTGGFGATYWVQDGTSFAAPLVSGAAALAKQKWPQLTSDEFEFLVRQTADDAGQPGFDPHFGAGTLNVDRMLSFNFPPHVTAVSVSPSAVPGTAVRLRAQVDNLEGDTDIASVTADLTALGLSPVALSNTASGIYESNPVTIPPETAIGSYTVPVSVEDAGGAQAAADLQIQVVAVAPPQYAAPGAAGPSPTAIEITGPERSRDFATNEDRVTLQGTASPDVAFIEVNGQPIAYTAGAATWSADVELVDGKNDVLVRGFDLARSNDASDEVTIDLDQDAPDRVRDLKASGTVLSWTAPKAHDVEGYTIYQLTGKKSKRVGATRKREYSVKAAGTYVVIAEDRAGNAIAPKKGSPVVVGASSSSAFVDVPATHFARTAVDALAARGIVQAGTFFWPERPMTRAEFAKLLVLSVGKEASTRPSSTFADVASTHPLATYIAIAVREGWAHGADGRFYPDRAITRGEAALMLVRARGLSFKSAQAFPDTEGAVGAAAGALRDRGIVTGMNGRFAPNQPLLRGEAAKMIASQ